VNSFHPEPRLSTGDRATLTDYKASGYDRGHMAPNGDMPTTGAQQESFSLANMIPQSKRINEGVWEGIETAVRNAVERGEGAYLITGPLFEGKTLQQINDRVLVPTAVFKMVYFPDKHRGAAYVATNDRDADTHDYDVVSVADLEKRIGINLLPGVPDSVKAVRAELPSPEIRGHGKSKAKSRRAHRSTWIVQ
jgi:endonuclease G